MKWFSFLVVFATATPTFASPAKGAVKNQTAAYCKGYFSEHSHDHLDMEQALGVWYQISDKPNQLSCITIKKINKESRSSIAAELKPYINENNLDRFTTIVKKTCPEKVSNMTDYYLLAPLGDKGVFDTLYAPTLKNLTHIMARISYPLMVQKLEVDGKEYLRLLTCFELIFKEIADNLESLIFERKQKGIYKKAEIKHLEQVFSNGSV